MINVNGIGRLIVYKDLHARDLEVVCLKVQIPHDRPLDCHDLQWDVNMRHYKGAPKITYC